jgi:hypothetical protein
MYFASNDRKGTAQSMYDFILINLDGESVLKPHIINWAKSKEIRGIPNEDNV